MREQTVIRSILVTEAERTKVAYEQARRDFKAITDDIPTGLPHPDGTDRIRSAGTSYRSTLNAYALAVRQLNAYAVDGTIPDWLRESES